MDLGRKNVYRGSGRIDKNKDSFAFDKGYANGDFEISAKIEKIPKYENGPYNGIMLREDEDADSKFIMISDSWRKYGENILVAVREEKGGEVKILWFKDTEEKEIKNGSSYDTTKYPLPKYIKAERIGNKLTLAVSNNGEDYKNNIRQPMEFDISDWDDCVLVGLAADSVNGNYNEANPMLPWYTMAAFSNIKLKRYITG